MCIGYFTDPYPDEILYSALARLDTRMRYPNRTTLVQQMFGSNNSVVDLPGNLIHFINVLPPNNYSIERLINKNTLLPFYAPFIPSDRIQCVIQAMRGGSSSNIHARLGLTNCRLKLPKWLRFCPRCVEQDRNEAGEAYWHRIHQLTGIEVCPSHAVFLEDSKAAWRNTRNHGKLSSAENSVFYISCRAIDLADPQHAFLLKIAKDADWLLNWYGPYIGLDILRGRYYNLLLKYNLAYYNGRIRATKLLKDFINFYSPEFLSRINCSIVDGDENWLFRIVSKGKPLTAQHPLYHLLIINFLGLPIEQLFTSFTEFKPFGNSPWPCLNHASDHFGQHLITECKVSDCLEKPGEPIGVFSCKCGFIYTRTGPDNSDEDRLKFNSIQSYGAVWEERLRKLWKNKNISLGEIASQLGVSNLTVVRHAIRLDLPMNQPNSRSVSEKTIERYKKFRPQIQDLLSLYRRKWMAVLKANHGYSRKQLIQKANFLYLWLRKNDAQWIESHLPKTKRPPVKRNRDWKSIDRSLSAEIKACAIRIKNLHGHPVRVSITNIIKEVGHRGWIESYLHNLPLTTKIITKHVESLEAFSIRKINWTEKCYLQEGICPTRHQFMVRAGLRNKTGSTRQVQRMVDSVIERLAARPQLMHNHLAEKKERRNVR